MMPADTASRSARRFFGTSLCIALALTVAPGASAQTDRFPDLWSVDNLVEGMAVLGDTLFATGRFSRVGPSTGQLAVLDKTTGEADTSYPPFDALGLESAGITDIIPDGQGGYYVGGNFGAVAEQARRNLARVLPNGTLDPDFQPAPQFVGGSSGFFGVVTALTLDRDAASPSGAGVLYVGGQFNTVGGQTRQNLAALDAATGEVLPLQATFAYPSTTAYAPFVETLLVHAGVLYVGGVFEQVSGQSHTGLVALDAATGAVLPWRADLADENPNFLAFPDALALGDGTLYLGGGFDFVNGQRRFGPAELTLADPVTGQGGVVTPWAPTLGGLDNITGVDLLVVGDFVYVAALSRGTLRVNRATAQVQSLGTGVVRAEALAYDPTTGSQGTVYVGGQGPNPGGTTLFPVVVAVDAATGQPTGYRVSGASAGSTVNALAVEPGPAGRLFAGGSFFTLGAGIVRRQGLAAFDLTTGRPTDFAAGISGAGQGLFEDLALSPDGRFLYGYSNIVGGAALDLTEFDLVTGATRQFIPQGLTATTYGASAHVAEARDRPAHRTEARTPAALNPRVENAGSAVVVTDTRVCVGLSGVACYDRATTDLLFYASMVYVSAGGEDNGNLLYLPPGGPFGNPGGPDGAIILAAPVEEAPVGTVHPAFVAVDVATGAVIEAWDVGFGRRLPLGFAGTMLDPDGPGGPVLPSLYLGGDFFSTASDLPVGARENLLSADPVTGAVRSWAPTVSGGTAPVLAMASHRTDDGRGVVYVGGTFFFANGVRFAAAAVAFDAETGADLGWGRESDGIPRVLLLSERHGAVFAGGSVGIAGTGHSNLVGLVPARPILPTAGEAGGPEMPVTRASVSLAGPNPLRSRTALAVSLPEAQDVQASLYDVLGRRVLVLHDGPLPAGTSRIDVDASALPAGVYVVRVSGAGFTEALTLTVVR